MYTTKVLLALAVCGGLATCGRTVGDQAIIGAAAGYGTAAIVGGDLGTGAVAGAAANVLFCQLQPWNCN